ncbi:hypothetical protein ACLOJK_013434 [Asimina triloba]
MIDDEDATDRRCYHPSMVACQSDFRFEICICWSSYCRHYLDLGLLNRGDEAVVMIDKEEENAMADLMLSALLLVGRSGSGR